MEKKQFEEITEWQEKTFGSATPMSKIHHLKEEVDELLVELKHYYETGFPKSETSFQDAKIEMEFADCFLLLFGAASSHGMNYEQICKGIELKMEINRKRKWGKPDKNGVVNHIK